MPSTAVADHESLAAALAQPDPGEEPLFDGRRICGTIARFDARHNYGFVSPSDPTCVGPRDTEYGENYFLHGADVVDEHPDGIQAGQVVEFSVVRGQDKRRYKAVRCIRVETAGAAPARPLPPPRPAPGQADPFAFRPAARVSPLVDDWSDEE